MVPHKITTHTQQLQLVGTGCVCQPHAVRRIANRMKRIVLLMRTPIKSLRWEIAKRRFIMANATGQEEKEREYKAVELAGM